MSNLNCGRKKFDKLKLGVTRVGTKNIQIKTKTEKKQQQNKNKKQRQTKKGKEIKQILKETKLVEKRQEEVRLCAVDVN